jgi:hypothetical protein
VRHPHPARQDNAADRRPDQSVHAPHRGRGSGIRHPQREVSAFALLYVQLWALWRYSRDDEADFRRRVRVFALSDARAGSTVERVRLAVHWKTQYDEIAALVKEHAADILDDQDFAQFKLMGDFYRHMPDVLATMFDTVQPRSFEELVQYGFDDLPEVP